MRQRVFVEEIKGHSAIVIGQRASSCGSCAGKASCNTLGSWKEASGNGRVLRLCVDNDIGAKVDDEVVIEVADSLLLKTAFRLYAVPMFIFVIVGGLVWQWVAMHGGDGKDVSAALLGFLGVCLYYFWIWYQGAPEGFDAKIVEISARAIEDQ